MENRIWSCCHPVEFVAGLGNGMHILVAVCPRVHHQALGLQLGGHVSRKTNESFDRTVLIEDVPSPNLLVREAAAAHD